jgi:hypothetical protein
VGTSETLALAREDALFTLVGTKSETSHSGGLVFIDVIYFLNSIFTKDITYLALTEVEILF